MKILEMAHGDRMGAVDCEDISYCGTGVVCTLSFFSDIGI